MYVVVIVGIVGVVRLARMVHTRGTPSSIPYQTVACMCELDLAPGVVTLYPYMRSSIFPAAQKKQAVNVCVRCSPYRKDIGHKRVKSSGIFPNSYILLCIMGKDREPHLETL